MSNCVETEGIKEGDHIIVKTEDCMRLVELKRNKPQFIGKRKIRFFTAIGHTYGSFFEIKSDGTVVKSEKPEEVGELLAKLDENRDIKDNRDLVDTGVSQKLTTSDIEAFKKQGLSGQELVTKIVENSSSFQEKTAFAKEKYIRKKQKKYMNFVQILKPNIRLLAEMYYMQGPLKICNLRVDSLSQMLAFCNVMSGGRYVVMDGVVGLLTAAVLERLGPSGFVVQVHIGPFSIQTHQQVIRALNIPCDQLQSLLYNIDLKSVMDSKTAVPENFDEPMTIDPLVNETSEKKMPDTEMTSKGEARDHKIEADVLASNDENSPSKEVDEPMTVDTVENETSEKSTHGEERASKVEKRDHIQKVKDILMPKNMDSLLIAVKHHPGNALELLDFLSPSRPFAIFSMFQSPLVECYEKLKSRGDIISLNLSETWLRKYQVLSERTHPFYNMSGHGGFLLTGIKVERRC